MRDTFEMSRDIRHLLCATSAAAFAALGSAVSAQSADTFDLPAGCTAYATVQNKDCTVDHLFTCQNDPDGYQKRVTLDEEGLSYLGTIDAETQWVDSISARSGIAEQLEPTPSDPASFSELLETGIDTYDFRTLSDQTGATRFVGADELTGEVEVVDGVTLEVTNYQITAFNEDGDEMWSSKGREYINRDWRRFFAGTSVVTVPGDSYERDGRPVEFIFPGEPGFLSANPKHGCGVVMSSSPVTDLLDYFENGLRES